MNGTGPSRPGGGAQAPDGPTTRAALAKAVDEEEANLHRLEVEYAESKARLGSLRAELAEPDARRETPAKLKIAEPLGDGPRTPTDKSTAHAKKVTRSSSTTTSSRTRMISSGRSSRR